VIHFDTEWHRVLADRQQIYTFRCTKTTDLHSIMTSVFVMKCDTSSISCVLLGRVQTTAFCRNVTGIRRSEGCCCSIRSVRFAARADLPCYRFSGAHRRMLLYTARSRSDVYLCSLWSSRGASTGTSSRWEHRTVCGSQLGALSPECARSCPKPEHLRRQNPARLRDAVIVRQNSRFWTRPIILSVVAGQNS